MARDPENHWFTRQNRSRLEGEAIRDGLLFISGQLNAALGGPSVQPPIPSDLARTSKSWTADVKGRITSGAAFMFSRVATCGFRFLKFSMARTVI